jgi:hypothetical protein
MWDTSLGGRDAARRTQMTNLKFTARKTTGTADFAHPAWAIYEGDCTVPRLRIDLGPGPLRWEVVALPGRYGLCPSDIQMAHEVQEHLHRDMDLAQVLGVVRALFEYEADMLRQEAMYELETERRAEQFWENRMSVQDYEREREEWANDPWLQMLEEGRR